MAAAARKGVQLVVARVLLWLRRLVLRMEPHHREIWWRDCTYFSVSVPFLREGP